MAMSRRQCKGEHVGKLSVCVENSGEVTISVRVWRVLPGVEYATLLTAWSGLQYATLLTAWSGLQYATLLTALSLINTPRYLSVGDIWRRSALEWFGDVWKVLQSSVQF